jgi:hypothetical protein
MRLTGSIAIAMPQEENAMTDVRGSIESRRFKPVPGGFVFQAPNPWVFGVARHYLVNAAQKSDILARMTPRRPILIGALVTMTVILWAVAMSALVWAFGSGHDDPTATDILVMAALIVVPMILAVPLAIGLQLRRLQPVLAGLPLTDERITAQEQRNAMVNDTSVAQSRLVAMSMGIVCLSLAFTLGMRFGRHPLFADAGAIAMLVGAIAAAGVAVRFAALAIRKARQKHDES